MVHQTTAKNPSRPAVPDDHADNAREEFGSLILPDVVIAVTRSKPNRPIASPVFNSNCRRHRPHIKCLLLLLVAR